MSGKFQKLHAIHLVHAPTCPYDAAERAVATVLVLDRKDDVECDGMSEDEREELGCAYRAQEGIAERAGLSRRTTQRALQSLLERIDGPLIFTAKARWRGDGGRRSNLYRIDLRPLSQKRQRDAGGMRHHGVGGMRQRDAGGASARQEGMRQCDAGPRVSVAQDLSTLELGTSDLVTSQKEAAVSGAAEDSSAQQLQTFYVGEFERHRGAKPLPFDAQDQRAVGELLAKCGGDVARAEAVIRGAFQSWRAHALTIRQIARNPSEFIGARRQGRAAPVQHTPESTGITGFEACVDFVPKKAAGSGDG